METVARRRMLREFFEIRAVGDEVQQLAVEAARRLGTVAVAGPAALLQDDSLEALLLADPQWYGLWPLELACRRGLPVFCGVGLEHDDNHADALLQQVQARNLPVMTALGLRLAPERPWRFWITGDPTVSRYVAAKPRSPRKH